ncbi:LOW QUALITY PROTEIN: probable N-acetyltransferase san [Haliotis rubra]|uniref:LOW QUALITY PROTEIN: probable N-acetyltransferase san n=1 Tax=Haliotis rubra TaxID=36100 RepID=UPI001EE50F59|nr:LOW QUALITY PROTEIN: probable N-acetyltransferase san [Haliotis rubra]
MEDHYTNCAKQRPNQRRLQRRQHPRAPPYYNDIVIGAVCCRIDTSENQLRLYIMTLGCLQPYRRLGIGTVMLQHVLRICDKDANFDNVFLHVQINNDGAIRFYEKFGFEIVEEKQNYYKRIEPADAYVLQKSFRVTNNNNQPASEETTSNNTDMMES